MSATPLLEVKNLTKTFAVAGARGKKHLYALDDVTFSVAADPPTITTLAGESGSGKTTISRVVLGLMRPTSGQILFEGRPLAEILKKDRLAYIKRVQAVFQDPYEVYNPFYSVDRLLEMPIRKFRLARTNAAKQALMEQALDAVGLSMDRVHGRFPHQLSGGEAQRVAIARALLPRPHLLIADEPVSMVDMSLRAGILNVLLKLKQEFHMSIIFVTHDLSVAYYLSDRIILLNRGRIVEMGDVQKVVKGPVHPYVQELMRSIPVPNPRHRWERDSSFGARHETLGKKAGCIYLERCPHPKDQCRDFDPEIVEFEPDHFAACHVREGATAT